MNGNDHGVNEEKRNVAHGDNEVVD